MKVKDITVVALRLYALMLFFDCVQGVYRLFFYLYYPMKQDDPLAKIVVIDGVTSVIFCIVVGTLLFKFSERIATWIIPANAEEGLTQIESSNLLRMCLGIAGAIFLVNGIRILGYSSALLYFLPADSLSQFWPNMTLEQKAKFVEAFILIISGLVLLMGKKGLTNFIRGIRTSGLPKSANEEGITEEQKETTGL
jgi:hypothetical protein